MIELTTVFDNLYSELKPITENLGFKADVPENAEKGAHLLRVHRADHPA